MITPSPMLDWHQSPALGWRTRKVGVRVVMRWWFRLRWAARNPGMDDIAMASSYERRATKSHGFVGVEQAGELIRIQFCYGEEREVVSLKDVNIVGAEKVVRAVDMDDVGIVR
ncbi:hypothetical protein KSP39_PZI014712 [Platanthera zijinensis]|uniref:Uncharacterized protein n=1 Tax=Platanthera zijinensis TaxID=2320716 RepID=A0AAP0G294_9ASPA